MSVDKFGRHSQNKRAHSLRGPKGEGYNLTPEGDYDLKQKRIRYLEDPKEETDAVNLKTLKNTLSENMQTLKTSFGTEAKSQFEKVETNLKRHLEKADKITEAIDISGGYVSLKRQRRIVGVKPSVDLNDVIIKEELTALEKKVKEKQNKVFDIHQAENEKHGSLNVKSHRRISKVSRATDEYDVIVKI